ncbi:MAG: TolC family protein [Bacteroidota bacterium]
MKNIFLFVALSIALTPLISQTNLTLEEAFQIALESNQDINIAKQKSVAESKKVFKANAGLTPVVSFFGSGEYSLNSVQLAVNTFGPEGGGTQEIGPEFGGSMVHNAGIQIDYSLFDGGRGKKRYQQLQNRSNLSALQQQATVDNTLSKVSQLYLNIASLEQSHKLLEQNIELSQERLERAQLANKYAKGNEVSILSAKTDLNTDIISLKNLERTIKNSKVDLLRLLNIDNDFSFSTDTILSLKSLPPYETLRAAALQKNPEILLAKQGVIIEKQQLEIVKSDDLPQINVFGRNSILRQDYEVNQIQYLQSIGPSAGFSISRTIYNGNKRRKDKEIQQLQINISEQEEVLVTQNVLKDLEKSWNTYQNIKEQVAFEQENLPFYQENLRYLQIDYKVGKATDTDIRTAQLNLLSAQLSITQKQIELEIEHFKLLKAAGLITTF